jgi:hypothetical protein
MLVSFLCILMLGLFMIYNFIATEIKLETIAERFALRELEMIDVLVNTAAVMTQ